jgi:hypothetical protein
MIIYLTSSVVDQNFFPLGSGSGFGPRLNFEFRSALLIKNLLDFTLFVLKDQRIIHPFQPFQKIPIIFSHNLKLEL